MDTIDYKASFEQSSALMMMLNTDFTIVAVSDSFLNATKTIRESIIGRDVFDVFPDNPNDITAYGESKIRASLNRVLKNKTTDTISVIKYDIPRPESDGGDFVMKYWQPCHSPVLDEFNNVKYIIQRVEDVTYNETLIAQLELEKGLLKHVSDSEKCYSMLLMKSPFAFAVFKGKEMVITVADDSMKKIWQKDGQIEGKPLFEVLPELKDTLLPGLLDEVYTTGIPFRGDDVLAQFQRGDKLEDSYYNFIYQPYHEADGTISGVTAIAYDVTEMVLARKKLEESEYKYRMLIEESSIATALFLGPDNRIIYANDTMLSYWAKDKTIIGKTMIEAIPELIGQPFISYLKAVYTTGIPYTGTEEKAEITVNGKLQTFYFNYSYKALLDLEGKIYGINIMAMDATDQVLGQRKIKESEERFRNLVEKSPSPICILKGEDMVLEVANEQMFNVLNVDNEALGKPFLDIIPEMKGQPFMGWLSDVYHNGTTHYGNEEPAYFMRKNGKPETVYFNFVYQPYRGDDGTITGVMVIASDVTGQVNARKKIEQSELYFRQMADLMPANISNADTEGNVLYFNKRWLDYTGLSFVELQNLGYHKIIHPDELEEFQKRFKESSDARTDLKMEMRFLDKNGEYKWHLNIASPVKDETGNITMWVGSTTEIHEQKMVSEKIRDSEERFRRLVIQAPVAICVLRGEDYLIETANEPMVQIWGRTMEEAINKPAFDVLPEFRDQGLKELLDQVYSTGENIIVNEMLLNIKRNGALENVFVKFLYEPLREADGTITGVMAVAHEITDQVIARKKIEESEHRYHEMIFSSPSMIAILKGEEMIIDIANDAILETWGKGKDIFGKSLLTVMPEIVEQGFAELFHQVYTTGQPNYGYEVPVYVMRNGKSELSYYTFVYQAQRDINDAIDGVAIIATEVTPQAELNKKIKDSEERFRRLVMQAPVAMCVLRGEDYLIETANEPMVQLWGRTMEEAMNKPAFDVLPELRDQGLKELLDQVYSTGENIVVNEMILNIKRNGALENVFVKFLYEPLRDADGTITGVMAVAHEITDQVIARKRIEESERVFRQLLDTMPQIAWTNTVKGEITFYNQRWYGYTGLSHQQTIALGCKNVIHPDDLQVALDHYRSIRETIEGGEFQIRGKSSDGSYRWHLIRLMPIKNEAGEVQMWMGTATDIQELRLLQQQKDDFISIASHELKTPITSLKASLQLLNRIKDKPSNTMLPKLIGQANKSLDKVTVLMDDLLNASIANEGQLHINKKLVTLSEIIEDCCPHVRAEGIFNIKTEGDMQVKVYADAARIDQVVINFVNNAIKYASGSKVIRICIEKVGDMAKVSIIDKGPGIPPDKLLHLFDRFYRVDSSGSQYSGLGLGLYISSEIIKKHNGQIGVESELGQGSAFWFTLPVA